MSTNRILLVEDNDSIRNNLTFGLVSEGFEVRTASDGQSADATLASGSTSLAVDIVILDWALPDLDGVTLIQQLRARGQCVPVLMITGRNAIEDRVHALESGADDYLVKPFAFAELLARVRALIRRSSSSRTPCHRNIADLSINLETRLVTRAGQIIDLTPREFDLLAYLAFHQGQVISRDQLAREVWREYNRATPINNAIDVHIARLRRKIDVSCPYAEKLLHTVHGCGYMLRLPIPIVHPTN